MIFSRPLPAVILFATLGSVALAATPVRAKPTRPTTPADSTAYKAAIITDAATGNTLFEDRADNVSPPASMTKLMTFAVLHDKLASGAVTLDQAVRITDADAKIGGSQVYLDPRETFPVEELVYAMMIHSANDAAHALARTAAGSIDAFVELMNTKARELGMTHTTFHTPHGLPPATRRAEEGDLTTPRDFALLARYLVQKTNVLKYSSIRTRSFGAGVRAKPFDLTNSDHLIGRVAGVDGLKTGFTNGAGFCLTATALRNGRRVIVVLMGAPESKVRDLKVTELLDRGFAALPVGGPAFAAAESSPIAAAPLPAPTAKAAKPDAGPAIKFSIPPAKR
ncbi:MAG: D-alanyl-D-alanine carboxypeptidase [Opitutus sp.]|nr:D-alanyl-D-alanine carboxypeptidase [Opitutus sp.]